MQVSAINVDAQRSDNGSATFPLTLVCDSADATLETAVEWIHENRESLSSKATEHGAVLFAVFPLSTDQDFDAFITAFDLP